MAPTIINAPQRIVPDALGPGDCFVGSYPGCMPFRKSRKGCYEINLHADLNDNEKKRRLGALVSFIRSHPGRTFYFSKIGCGRGHVDVKIVEHLTKPLVWLDNVRLPASFLTDLLKDSGYMSGLDPERREALRAWHRGYCASGERMRDPSFHRAVQGFGPDVRDSIFGIVADYRLNSSLFSDDAVFKSFMTRLRDTLEMITAVPLPGCLEGTADRYQSITLGGKAHLYGHGYNVLPNSKPPVIHNLRADLKAWVAEEGNHEIFEKLKYLVDCANAWAHNGERDNYDTLPEEVLSDFKYLVIRFPEFLAEVRKEASA